MKIHATSGGFTLIELMIAVAIVGILASIAIPSYQDSVKKSRRVDAEGALMGLANAMERHYTEHTNYCDVGGADGGDSCGDSGVNDHGTPSNTLYSAPGNITTYYDFTIKNDITANKYTLLATPKGAQANDKCGVLTLSSIGQRDAVKGGTSVTGCWD